MECQPKRGARKLERRAIVALVGGLLLMGPRAESGAAPAPCGTQATPPATYSHVVWIWMENHSYGKIVGSSSAPYINSLIANCGLATNYHNVSHPSLPNYIAATSGLSLGGLRRFDPDCDPTGRCTTRRPSLFSRAAGWHAYEESMPSNCLGQDSGQYAVRHNPPPYYTRLHDCALNDVPYTQLQTDLQANTLPAFAFITPNVCNDMHNCSVAQGDAWLQAEVPKLLASAAYQSGTMALFITWDEGTGGSSNDCATNTSDVGCHVATIMVSPSTPKGSTSAVLFNHYSLLRTTQEMLGSRRFLGKAGRATSMRPAFNL